MPPKVPAMRNIVGMAPEGGAAPSGDSRTICRAQGVGAKLGQRIVLELAGKAGAVGAGAAPTAAPAGSAANDAVSALLNLGFRPAEASSAVARAEAELGTDVSFDALVRSALKNAAR